MYKNTGNIKKNIFKTAVFVFLFAAQFTMVFSVSAQNPTSTNKTVSLTNPLGSTDINVIGAGVIKTAMGVLGSITLLVFVIGGVMWLTSGGSPERVQMGTKTMLYATIGIFVIFTSYAILSAIIKGLTG